MARRKKKTATRRRSLAARVRRGAARVRTIVRKVVTMKARRRRGGQARARGLGSIVPTGLIKTAATTAAGFIGVGYLFSWLGERFPQIGASSPWMRIALKAATAIGAGWALRRFASPVIGMAAGVGGLVAAGIDAFLQFQQNRTSGLSGARENVTVANAAKPREIAATQPAPSGLSLQLASIRRAAAVA